MRIILRVTSVLLLMLSILHYLWYLPKPVVNPDLKYVDTITVSDPSPNPKIYTKTVTAPPTITVSNDLNVKPFKPIRIEIPKAEVNAEIVELKVINNQLQAPTDFNKVGWDIGSGLIGDNKTAIMDGHYDSKTGKAVFYGLQYLRINDIVTVYSSNSKLYYKVVCIESYDRFNAPLDKIYKNDGRKRLNLITCNGVFDKKLGSYNRRLVVYTVIV